jgi:hypothetical protein
LVGSWQVPVVDTTETPMQARPAGLHESGWPFWATAQVVPSRLPLLLPPLLLDWLPPLLLVLPMLVIEPLDPELFPWLAEPELLPLLPVPLELPTVTLPLLLFPWPELLLVPVVPESSHSNCVTQVPASSPEAQQIRPLPQLGHFPAEPLEELPLLELFDSPLLLLAPPLELLELLPELELDDVPPSSPSPAAPRQPANATASPANTDTLVKLGMRPPRIPAQLKTTEHRGRGHLLTNGARAS